MHNTCDMRQVMLSKHHRVFHIIHFLSAKNQGIEQGNITASQLHTLVLQHISFLLYGNYTG